VHFNIGANATRKNDAAMEKAAKERQNLLTSQGLTSGPTPPKSRPEEKAANKLCKDFGTKPIAVKQP